MLGLSFKPNTDDMREAPSLVLIQSLLESGCEVKAYDPAAMHETQRKIGNVITYCNSIEETIKETDALFLVTEWAEFKENYAKQIMSAMSGTAVVDTRNVLNQKTWQDAGAIFPNATATKSN